MLHPIVRDKNNEGKNRGEEGTTPVTPACPEAGKFEVGNIYIARSEYHTQLAKMSFDEIFDLTAGVYFNFYNIYIYFFLFFFFFPKPSDLFHALKDL